MRHRWLNSPLVCAIFSLCIFSSSFVFAGARQICFPAANVIRCSNPDGTEMQDIITTGIVNVFDVAVDPFASKLYWSDQLGTIGRANLDGSQQEDILTQNEGLDNPLGIALDTHARKIYFINTDGASASQIQRANLDGSNIEVVINNLTFTRRIALGHL